jgi:uncharacterized protein (TIGR03118 family)
MHMNLPPRGLALCTALAVALACAAPAAARPYQLRNLVSDGTIAAEHTDPNLVNGWGVAFNPVGFVWVSAADGMVSTLYDGDGNPQSLVVQIPSPGSSTGGNPTGIVYNGAGGFLADPGNPQSSSLFIFATEQGAIAGWSPAVDSTHAIMEVDNSASGATYKGLALGTEGMRQLLYATDFYHARVDVFDSGFQPVSLPAGAFTDPSLPPRFAPFGIQAIGSDIYVTYAKQDPSMTEEMTGPGLGYVDVYAANGRLKRRVASRGALNAPWGIAMAPEGFGRFSKALLVGNFGDGRINGYGAVFGKPLGTLRGANGPIHVDGLWGMAFGNGVQNQPVNTLFFAAGPDDEEHGLYGRIDAGD